MFFKAYFICAFFVTLFGVTVGLHLEVPALSNPEPVCIRDFAQKDQLVVVNIKTSGHEGDGQQLSLKVTDSLGSELIVKDKIGVQASVAFNVYHNSAFDVCFTNRLEKRWSRSPDHVREIELDIESGAAARDWNSLQAIEKLKPVEVELRRIDELTQEIAGELEYLKRREESMRDTNESTNSRVKWFSSLVVLSLVGLGVWQLQYLRHYFKVKHII